jgi:hypothetical protein
MINMTYIEMSVSGGEITLQLVYSSPLTYILPTLIYQPIPNRYTKEQSWHSLLVTVQLII